MKNEGGFTLIEILAGIFILGIVLSVFFQFFVFSQKTTTDNKEQLVALRIAESILERIVSEDDNVTDGYRDDLKRLDPVNNIESCTVGADNCKEMYQFPNDNPKYFITIEVSHSELDENTKNLGLYSVEIRVFGSVRDAQDNKDERVISNVKGLVEL